MSEAELLWHEVRLLWRASYGHYDILSRTNIWLPVPVVAPGGVPFPINPHLFHDLLLSPISQHNVWSELTSHNPFPLKCNQAWSIDRAKRPMNNSRMVEVRR